MSTLLEIGVNNALLATLMAALAACVSRLVRRPALAHGLWLLVLLRLLMPPLVPMPVGWSHLLSWPVTRSTQTVMEDSSAFAVFPLPPSEDSGSTALAAASPPCVPLVPPKLEDLPEPDLEGTLVGGWWDKQSFFSRWQWKDMVAALWIAGSLLALIAAVIQIMRFRRMLCFARPAPAALREMTTSLAKRLSLPRCPSIWFVPGAVSPMVWAFGPFQRILFPAQLLERLDIEQLKSLLIHELAHIRRRDPWVRIVEVVAFCLFWWHPIMWWARRELREAEEQCCDAWVVWVLEGAARSYALALLRTVDFFSNVQSTLPMTASGIGHVPQLKRRLTMIMRANTPMALSRKGALIVLVAGLLLLPLVPLHAVQAPRDTSAGAQENKDAADQIQVLKKLILEIERQQSEQQKLEKEKWLKQKFAQDHQTRVRAVINQLARDIKAKREELTRMEHQYQELLTEFKGGEEKGGESSVKQPAKTVQLAPVFTSEVLSKAIINATRPKDHNQELERKLDRLMKEISDLKTEIHRESSKTNLPFPLASFAVDATVQPSADSLNNQAWSMATSANPKERDGKQAVELATKACQQSDWKNPLYLDTLAAAYAEIGQYKKALQHQKKALENSQGLGGFLGGAQERLKLYEAGSPYHENVPPVPELKK